MHRSRFIGNSNVPAETGNVQSGWDILVAECPKGWIQTWHIFCPELIFNQFPNPWVILQKMQFFEFS